MEELRTMIQESFSNANVQGKVEVAKLYAEILLEIETQLNFMLEGEPEDN